MALTINVSNNPEKAIRDLKRKMQQELIFRSMKASRFYEPESVKRVKRKKETVKRIRNNNRKRRLEL